MGVVNFLDQVASTGIFGILIFQVWMFNEIKIIGPGFPDFLLQK